MIEDDDASTAAMIVRNLEVVVHELHGIDTIWLDMPRDVTNTSVIHEARRRNRELLAAAQSYLSWVADGRLERPTN